jgi:hypothetical protein
VEGKRWAAFCAATVEELCNRTSFPCPSWVHQPSYILEKTWFSAPEMVQECLVATTPEPFLRRHIFTAGSMFDNQYELQ